MPETNAWFALSESQRKNIFNQVSMQTGLPEVAIEKDWWVSLALKVVFSLSFSEHLVFKGGTSLSKGWALIERFSEDIDLALDRSLLGYEGDLSKSQIKKLRKDSCTFISETFKNEVESKLQEMNIPEVKIQVQDFKDSDTDPLIVALHYKSLTEGSAYIQPRILLEIGARSLIEPYEERPIQSLVGKQYSDRDFADDATLVPTVLPTRTFLEKIFMLHEEFQKPYQSIRIERLSRHLYDLEKLMDTEHGKQALQDEALYLAIVSHRKQFNTIRGIDYALHNSKALNIIPPQAVIKAWKLDYNSMRESMIYGDTLSFEKLIQRLSELESRIRNIK